MGDGNRGGGFVITELQGRQESKQQQFVIILYTHDVKKKKKKFANSSYNPSSSQQTKVTNIHNMQPRGGLFNNNRSPCILHVFLGCAGRGAGGIDLTGLE